MDELYVPEDLARYLSTTVGNLAQMRYRGIGPKFVKVGRGIRYRTSDVNEWLAQQTRERTGEPASA